MEIVQRIPWETTEHAIVIHTVTEKDGTKSAVLNISEMSWKDRMWLSAELQNFNAAEGAVQWMERDRDWT